MMTTKKARLGLLLALGLVAAGCAEPFEAGRDGSTTGDGGALDGGKICTDPNGDEDGDGIPNGEEGCLTGRDTDGDGIPDWQDFDSDNDGIPDEIEAGEKDNSGKCKHTKPPHNGWPCDSDRDGMPDYLDVDSDNDGLLDKEEDVNGDGLLGCCLTTCNAPGTKQALECLLTDDGCGAGQTCNNGSCAPPIGFECSVGETDPKKKDTFGDGLLDNERGTFICRDATEDNPKGRKPVQLRQSATGDWHVALEKTAKYGELKITGAGAKDAAGVIDDDDPQAEVAGFVISRATTKQNVQEELTEILQAIGAKPPGGSGTVSQRASGTQVKSHDLYDSIQGTILDVTLSTASNVSTARNELVGTLLNRSMAELGNLPGPYGSSHTELVVRLVMMKRVEFKRDSQNNLLDADGNKVTDSGKPPVDNGDKTKWRLLVMGAVASKANYQDPARVTGFRVEDLSNGTSLAHFSDRVFDKCDVGIITNLPVADIIWVVDESGSMDDKRQDVVDNANNFFSRALSSGLDFRMGVTNVCSPNGGHKYAVGKFCSKISSDRYDVGGTDRFLLPSEQAIFSSCINNPPGYEGGSEYGLVNAKEVVTRHLPRASGDPSKIRPEAKLVIIVATDEVPESLSSIIGFSNFKKCTLDAATQANVNTALQPYLALFTGVTDPEAAATMHLIGGLCSSSGCSWAPDVAHGYLELVQQLGGQSGDVCQKDLGATLQIIIDDIAAGASPLKLQYVPISSSLAVAMDGAEIMRSRTNGFDYRSSANALVFINVKYKKGSQVIASYKRWQQGIILE